MGVNLTYDNRDLGKIFAKVAWRTSSDARKAGTKFSWDPEGGYYAYCNIVGNEIVFKKPSHEASIRMGRKTSKVGDGVLGSELKQLKFIQPGYYDLACTSAAAQDRRDQWLADITVPRNDALCSAVTSSIHDDNYDIEQRIYERICMALEHDRIIRNKNKEKEVDAVYSIYINETNKNQNKGITMPGETKTKTKTLKEELLEILMPEEAPVKEKTPFEARKKFSFEVYGTDEKLLEVVHCDSKKDAQAFLQDPKNIGKKVVVKKEVVVYTTDVPVVEL